MPEAHIPMEHSDEET